MKAACLSIAAWVSYASLACAGGPTEPEARDLLRKASASVSQVEPYASSWEYEVEIARAQFAAGDQDGAKAALARAVESALKTEKPADSALVQIARAQIACGLKVAAQPTLRKAFEIVKAEEDRAGPRAIGRMMQIFREQVRCGDQKGRDASAKSAMRLASERGNALPLGGVGIRFAVLASSGREEDAFVEVARMWIGPPAQPVLASEALSSMAEAVSQLDSKSALPLLERIQQSIQSLQLNPSQASYGLARVAKGLARAGDSRAACRLAFSLPEQQNNVSGPSETLYAIALIQEEQGDRDGAVATHRGAIGAFDRPAVLPNGNVGGTQIRTIVERANGKVVPREGALPQIAQALGRLGDIDPARALLPRIQEFLRRDVLLTFALVEQARGDLEAAKSDFALAASEARSRITKRVGAIDADTLVAMVRKTRKDPAKVDQIDYDLGSLAQVQAASGDLVAARATIAAITDVANQRNNEDADAIAAEMLATGRAMSGDLSGAITEGLAITEAKARVAAIGGAATGYLAWSKAQKPK